MNAICLPCREIEGKEAFRRAAESGLGVPPETGMRQKAPCARSRGDENTISRLSEPHVTPLMYSLSNVSCRGPAARCGNHEDFPSSSSAGKHTDECEPLPVRGVCRKEIFA